MNTIITKTEQLKTLYYTISHHKSKDKLDMILEPFQSMIQIALLSTSPIETKLAIQENILYLQIPGITQPISRWYNSDKKDDLFFLFQVIKRFIKWYNPEISNKSPLSQDLYELIIKMCINGLENLTKTYNKTDNNNIIQIIYMYKSLLESNEKIDYLKSPDDKIKIDEIFENIIEIYDNNLILLIHNLLLMISTEDNSIYINNYIQGLNLIMEKNNNLIKNWIKEKLAF
jgi:hypothetical protein